MDLLGLMPDRDVTTPGGFISCAGYESTMRGWRLQRALEQVAVAAPIDASGTCTGGLVSQTANGTEVIHLAGNGGPFDRSLYFRSDTTLVRASRAAPYSGNTDVWSFAQWGDLTYATNGWDAVQVRDATTTNHFADATASNIPKARIAFTWGPAPQRMMLLDYDAGSGRVYDGWWSSHQGGPLLDWGPVLADESVQNRLFGAGPLTAGIGYRDTAVMFGESGMWVGTYVGRQSLVVDVRKVADVGCSHMYGLTVMNGLLYFVGKQGLYVYDGSYPKRLDVPIQAHLIHRPGVPDYSPTLTSDPATQRLLLRSDRLYSISVLTGKVGELAEDGRFLLGDGYAVAFSALVRDSDLPLSNGNYIDLNPVGDAQIVSLIRRVQGRFAADPAVFNLQHCGSMSLLSPPAPPNFGIGRTKNAAPWRIDLLKSSRWHYLRLSLLADAATDPELQTLDLELAPDGSE